MGSLKETKYSLSNLSSHVKVTSVESSLEQCLTKIQELVMDYEQLKTNYKDYEAQYLIQKEKCESKTCNSSLELKRINEMKDNIIQSVASAITKLNETRDFNTINEIFSIIYEDTAVSDESRKSQPEKIQIKKLLEPMETQEIKEAHEESISEIEGTPTGRKSPIIFSKVSKNITRDKKKCPNNWGSPETKTIKLTKTPTRSASGRLVQTRLTTVKVKPNCFVDLTNSPELKTEKITLDTIQVDLKQEELDDETILPSPSGLVNFQSLQKSLKCSPHKFKKPNLSLKSKLESMKAGGNGMIIADENLFDFKTKTDRFNSPMKLEVQCTEQVADESMSLLRQMCKFDKNGEDLPKPGTVSPNKRPLTENNNIVNVKNRFDSENSMSILKNNPITSVTSTTTVAEDGEKRVKNVEPVYKEPTVRKKSEKRALKGWSCEQCKIFYDELYRDDPVMLAKKMEECSKHRGRHNPVRPKTPPGYWNPRWEVPTDTEEFNRRNNAL
ncbi:uncharacterized protein LOC121733385 [Aricia agestis]|uniref:uncharacterized protein LOC121733385 n=1 Tax=Aricia agestis TaxID=91739 RepID=UPI001C2036D2|nr:uncharacterized protein LOC121733385 [Aricia agestis]XP_041979549.1 uncharacterized protein LOC121733385 [Aricia agestis]